MKYGDFINKYSKIINDILKDKNENNEVIISKKKNYKKSQHY